MIIKLKRLDEIGGTLDKVLNRDMDVKLAYRMRKIAAKISAESKNLQKEANALYVKYGDLQKDPKGNLTGRYTLKAENKEKFQKDLDALLDMDVDLGGEKIPYECILGMKEISPMDLVNLGDLVAEPVEPK